MGKCDWFDLAESLWWLLCPHLFPWAWVFSFRKFSDFLQTVATSIQHHIQLCKKSVILDFSWRDVCVSAIFKPGWRVNWTLLCIASFRVLMFAAPAFWIIAQQKDFWHRQHCWRAWRGSFWAVLQTPGGWREQWSAKNKRRYHRDKQTLKSYDSIEVHRYSQVWEVESLVPHREIVWK